MIYKQNTNLNVENEQIINFIFACLGEKGRDASILFTFIDFGEDHMNFISQLIDNYESEFDFNFLKESLCKLAIKIYKFNGELKSLNEDQNNEIEALKLQTENAIRENESFQDKINKSKHVLCLEILNSQLREFIIVHFLVQMLNQFYLKKNFSIKRIPNSVFEKSSIRKLFIPNINEFLCDLCRIALFGRLFVQ